MGYAAISVTTANCVEQVKTENPGCFPGIKLVGYVFKLNMFYLMIMCLDLVLYSSDYPVLTGRKSSIALKN